MYEEPPPTFGSTMKTYFTLGIGVSLGVTAFSVLLRMVGFYAWPRALLPRRSTRRGVRLLQRHRRDAQSRAEARRSPTVTINRR